MDNYAALFGKSLGAGSGGSGTDNYNELTNKPSINGTVLSGNKTAANLGLQPEIKESSKLSSYLVDDSNSSQKFVSPSDIENWNSKQNAISDLAAIRSGAAAGATAVQAADMSAALAAKVDSSEFTTDQQRQEEEIGVVANAGAKNIFDIQAPAAEQRITTVLNPDGGITISCNTAVWATRNVIADIPAGDYICSLFVDAVTIGGGAFAFFVNQSNDQSAWTELYRKSIASTGRTDELISVSQKYLRITTNINNSDTAATNSATIRLMLRPAAITDPTFQPYAKTNRELTILSDEDRASLVELVDEGAKNICDWAATTSTISGVTFTVNGDKTVSVSGTATARAQKALQFTVPSTLKAGRYVLSGCPSGGEQSGTILYCLYIWDKTVGTRVASGDDTGNGLEFDWIPDASHTYSITIDVRSGTNASGLIFKPMICIAADYAISPAFVPYRPSWQEMWEMIQALQSGGASTQSVQPTLLSVENTDDLQKDEIQIETEAEE